jgi:hypothetical protein
MTDVFSPPESGPIPSDRLAVLREKLVEEVSQSAWPSRRLRIGFSRRGYVVVVGCFVALLAIAGGAIGVGLNLVGEQERIDNAGIAPSEMRAIGARVEVARGDDWSLMAWRSQNGFCIASAWAGASGAVSNSVRSCGRVPSEEPGASRYLVATLGVPTPASDGRGLVAGIVMPTVSRIEIELADGRVLAARTVAAPEPLADVRIFLVRAKFDQVPIRPGGLRPVRAYSLFSPDGRLLERFAR